MSRFALPVVALVMVGMLSVTDALAQEATPVSVPVVPEPAECQVSPRTADELLALAATPTAAASPVAVRPATGEPADAATVAAVTATVREIVACGNAGESFAVLALYTDALVRRLIAPGLETGAEIAEPAATPRPVASRLALVAVRDVTVLEDGRVSAIVEVASIAAIDEVLPDLLIFAREEGRYRVDDVIAGGEVGTPVVAS